MDRTFCIFGDSIAQAAYVDEGWVNLFRKYLEEKHKDCFVNVFNLGIGGNTTDDLLERFPNEAKHRQPTSIVFQIGTNDSGYFKEITNLINTEGKFKYNLTELISEAKKFTEDITFLGLAIGNDSLTQPFPGSSRGKSYTKERIDKYDRILKTISSENNCKYARLLDKLKYEDFMDGLHPNESGQSKIFEEIKNFF